MDTLLVTIARKSCAISFTKGWECGMRCAFILWYLKMKTSSVSTIPDNGLGVFPDYILISFGYLVNFSSCLRIRRLMTTVPTDHLGSRPPLGAYPAQ